MRRPEFILAALAAVIAIRGQSALSEELMLNSSSRVLVIGTEGATDAAIYGRIVGRDPAQVVSN